MRKEVIIAIFAGILFGVVIAFGVWRANVAFNPQEPAESQTGQASESNDELQNNIDLTISEPANKSVFIDPSTSVKGLTKPNNIVVVSTEDEDFVIRADDDGSFDQSIDLVGGINQIVVASINESGIRSTEELVVIHSSEFEGKE